MYGNSDGIRRRLDIVHQKALAAREPDAADQKYEQRDRELRRSQIKLPQRSRRARKQEHDQKIPERIRIEQA